MWGLCFGGVFTMARNFGGGSDRQVSSSDDAAQSEVIESVPVKGNRTEETVMPSDSEIRVEGQVEGQVVQTAPVSDTSQAQPAPIIVNVTNTVSSENVNQNLNQNANVNVGGGYAISPKSKTVAALLCFFLGFLGIHRFYTGRVMRGVLFLCTCGLCGIGAIYDFIKILSGTYLDGAGARICR